MRYILDTDWSINLLPGLQAESVPVTSPPRVAQSLRNNTTRLPKRGGRTMRTWLSQGKEHIGMPSGGDSGEWGRLSCCSPHFWLSRNPDRVWHVNVRNVWAATHQDRPEGRDGRSGEGQPRETSPPEARTLHWTRCSSGSSSLPRYGPCRLRSWRGIAHTRYTDEAPISKKN